jgi:hypothetical protein
VAEASTAVLHTAVVDFMAEAASTVAAAFMVEVPTAGEASMVADRTAAVTDNRFSLFGNGWQRNAASHFVFPARQSSRRLRKNACYNLCRQPFKSRVLGKPGWSSLNLLGSGQNEQNVENLDRRWDRRGDVLYRRF